MTQTKLTPLRNILQMYYLDYWNNYLTVDKFAEHHGLTKVQAESFLRLGKKVFNSKHPED